MERDVTSYANPATQATSDPVKPSFALADDTSWSIDRPHTLKSNNSFAIFGRFGDMEAGTEGLYHRDTRHLSKLSVTLDRQRPRLLSSMILSDNSMLVCDLASHAAQRNADMGDEGNEILLRRETFLWRDTRHDRLSITNWSRVAQHVTVSISFAADFADLFEIRGTRRDRHGIMQTPVCAIRDVRLACLGLDGDTRCTWVGFEPKPDVLSGGQADYELDLASGATTQIALAIRCGKESIPKPSPEAIAAFMPARRMARRQSRIRRRAAAVVITGNPLIDTALCRARDDLIMLTTETKYGPYPYAGVPWFSTVFGRDAIITALQLLWAAPGLARGVLGYLAANQAMQTDEASDAEPGKILHEARDGDMARCGEVPFRRYYGSVDSTPLFVMLAGAYLERTGDIDFIRQFWPNVQAALDWIDLYGDADGDGFVEYGRRSADGLINQGWKDSRDSIFHANGALAQGPIALCEVQAYVFAAKQAACRIAEALGLTDRAASLHAQAASLRTAFDAAFWDDDLGSYVLALDGAKNPCRVLASNAGHSLFAGIALPERADQVINLLMSPAFFSGWGIRTIAQGQARYNPMSYHNGSVWPHDNALIGLGFGRYGRRDQAARLFDAMLATAGWEDRYRLPELFCGLARTASNAPTAYPVACAPQAWAAGALPALLDACIGLSFDPGARTATVASPVLPAKLRSLRIENLIAGDQRTALVLSRGPDGRVGVTG